MATAAHGRRLYARTDTTAPTGADEIDGALDFSWSTSMTMLETTDFRDATGTKTRVAGLEDGSGSIGGDWEQADAPQTLLRTQFAGRALVYVTDLRDGVNGYTYPCMIESVEERGAVDGKNEVTFNLVQSGALIARGGG